MIQLLEQLHQILETTRSKRIGEDIIAGTAGGKRIIEGIAVGAAEGVVIRHDERVLCGGERRALLTLFGVAILIDYALAYRGKL